MSVEGFVRTGRARKVHRLCRGIDAVKRGTTYYAQSRTLGPAVYLHRFLWAAWGCPSSDLLDHANRNGLDCRRANLRAATSSQNSANRVPLRRALPKGVTRVWASGRFKAQIVVDWRVVHLGRFGSPAEAARAYEQASYDFFGEFSCAGSAS